MMIAHLPAGYVVSRWLGGRLKSQAVFGKAFLWAGLLGSVVPDFDMFYFYLIDQRQHHHHTYFTHFPVLWFGLLLISLLWLRVAKEKNYAVLALVFSANAAFHMLLDTINGTMYWLAPFDQTPFALITVPALYQPWWLNFIFHWSFGVELVILAFAAYFWRREQREKAGKLAI